MKDFRRVEITVLFQN